MSDEEILRRLLKEEASTVNPRGSFDDVEGRLRRNRALPILAAVAAVAAVVVGVLLLNDDDGEDVVVPADTTTTEAPATTTSTTAAEPVDEVGQGVWPFTTGAEADASTDDTYLDPVATTRAFLDTYVGMTRYELSEFAQGDSRSGEVVVTTPTARDESVILLRQLGTSGAWTVIGAATDDIRIASPGALDEITSPVQVSGESCCAFEGNVVIQVRQDGQLGSETYLGQEPTIGGQQDHMPFEADIAFDAPSEPGGAIVAFTTSAEDGHIERVAVLRVHFAA